MFKNLIPSKNKMAYRIHQQRVISVLSPSCLDRQNFHKKTEKVLHRST